MRELLIFLVLAGAGVFAVYRSCTFEFFCPAEKLPGIPLEEVLTAADSEEKSTEKSVSADNSGQDSSAGKNDESNKEQAASSEEKKASKQSAEKTAEQASEKKKSSGECKPYLVKNIRPGANNDKEQVKLLEKFLNEFEGEKLVVGGVYDGLDQAAVKRFQEKYAEEILRPFGLSRPNGLVLEGTRRQINKLYCQKKST